MADPVDTILEELEAALNELSVEAQKAYDFNSVVQESDEVLISSMEECVTAIKDYESKLSEHPEAPVVVKGEYADDSTDEVDPENEVDKLINELMAEDIKFDIDVTLDSGSVPDQTDKDSISSNEHEGIVDTGKLTEELEGLFRDWEWFEKSKADVTQIDEDEDEDVSINTDDLKKDLNQVGTGENPNLLTEVEDFIEMDINNRGDKLMASVIASPGTTEPRTLGSGIPLAIARGSDSSGETMNEVQRIVIDPGLPIDNKYHPDETDVESTVSDEDNDIIETETSTNEQARSSDVEIPPPILDLPANHINTKEDGIIDKAVPVNETKYLPQSEINKLFGQFDAALNSLQTHLTHASR